MRTARIALAGALAAGTLLAAAPASAAEATPAPPSGGCVTEFLQWFVLYDPGPFIEDPVGWVLGYASGPVQLVDCIV